MFQYLVNLVLKNGNYYDNEEGWSDGDGDDDDDDDDYDDHLIVVSVVRKLVQINVVGVFGQ